MYLIIRKNAKIVMYSLPYRDQVKQMHRTSVRFMKRAICLLDLIIKSVSK